MKINITYSGKQINADDILFIKNLIKNNPGRSRRFISKELCRLWNWRQPNGYIKDMVCRGLLKKLEDNGLIIQPPKKCNPINPFVKRIPPQIVNVDKTPIKTDLKNLLPIELVSVRKTKYEKLYNSLIHQYHYLKYTYPIGEHLKYIAFSNQRAIACLGWMSAVWYIKCRDRFIGWKSAVRIKNLHLIAYNTRFLILPFVEVPNLASYILGLQAKRISSDWQAIYKHPIYYLETFVDRERGYIGTCYKATNWIYLGKTTGRGKLSKSNKPILSMKDVYGYPLCPNFREILCK